MSEILNLGFVHQEERLKNVFKKLTETLDFECDCGERCDDCIRASLINDLCLMKMNYHEVMDEDEELQGYLSVELLSTEKRNLTLIDIDLEISAEGVNAQVAYDIGFEQFINAFKKRYSTPDDEELIVIICPCCQKVGTKPWAEGMCPDCYTKACYSKEPCPICLEAGHSLWVRTTKCPQPHRFHKTCLSKTSVHGVSFCCPVCRTCQRLDDAKII